MQLSTEAKLRLYLIDHQELSEEDALTALCEEEPELVWRFARSKLGVFIRAFRHRKPSDPDQFSFPFPDLSVRIPIKDGFAELGPATIGLLRKSERLLSGKRMDAAKNVQPTSMLGRIRRQIELMEPYAYANRRITVQQVVDLRASGVPVPEIPADSPMSDAMRRYWDSKSPEERSAIARRREAARRAKKKAKKKP